MSGRRHGREDLQRAYLQACELDVTACKPGNVSLARPGHDMTADQFLLSARVTAPLLAAAALGVGERIYQAVAATRDAVGCNTNLGIVLLAAPMFAALQGDTLQPALGPRLQAALARLDLDDADWAYRAIRLAAPAGLGKSDRHDVADAPRVDLRRAMSAAAERDRIAYQYAHAYRDVLDHALPLLCRLLTRWRDPAWAATGVYMDLLARFPDSHVARKHGSGQAAAVQARARALSEELLSSTNPQRHLGALDRLDEALKRDRITPGTTADLTVATILAKDFDAFASQAATQAALRDCSGSELLRCVST